MSQFSKAAFLLICPALVAQSKCQVLENRQTTRVLIIGQKNRNESSFRCGYNIAYGGVNNGTPAVRAERGRIAYHIWECFGLGSSIRCVTVHSCFVVGGGGRKFPIYDFFGCPINPALMAQLKYWTPVKASVAVGVGEMLDTFQDPFAPVSRLHFNCQLRFHFRPHDAVCRRTTDACPQYKSNNQSNKRIRKRKAEENDVSVDAYLDCGDYKLLNHTQSGKRVSVVINH